MRRPVFLVLPLASLVGCVGGATDVDETESDVASAHAYYHLDAIDSNGHASVTVVNGYKVKCPSGAFAKTCQVSAITLPADCNFECKDGLLGLQGETVLRGHFDKQSFVVEAGFDSWRSGLGTYSIYRITGAASCAADPCPSGLHAQKLDTSSAATAIQSVDFSGADDTNYVLDPTRGDDQIASPQGLIVSGHIASHVFRADRVWRLETPKPACDPQSVARVHAYLGDATEIRQLRTVVEGEHATDPNSGSVAWLVRTGETTTTVSFTSGLNDLWVEEFDVAKSDCVITTTGEH